MHILHVVPTYLPAVRYGGPIHSVYGLCRALAELGHDVHVFTTSVDGPGDSDVPLGEPVDLDGVKVWYFASPMLRRLYYSPGMTRQLRQSLPDFDLLHLHSVFLWPTAMAARLAARSAVPYVLSPRGMLFRELIRRKSRLLKSTWIHLFEKRNLENAGMVHVTSALEAKGLDEFGFKLHRVVEIPNGVDNPRDYANAALSEDVAEIVISGNYVLFLGRINWKKGLDRLLEAWRGREQRLVIAGNDEDGYTDKLKRLAVALRVENVDFVARNVSGDDREALYRHAMLFVLPSYSENFGNTVLEAMVRSVAVLVTEEVGAAELVKRFHVGKVAAGTVEALRSALDELLADASALQAMGRRGQEAALQHFTWQGIAARMESAYVECLTPGRA
jgi:glycosyltransferase involved in cell wall biosynthesis